MRVDGKSEGQAVLGRQSLVSTPWLTERHGYDPTFAELLPWPDMNGLFRVRVTP